MTADELASPEVQTLIDDMIDTMHAANGAGLAANQVHESVRIAVIEVDHNPRYPYKPPIPLTVVVNPVIEPVDDETVEINEGCLSVPDLRGNVWRIVNIRVRYLDRHGVAHDEIKRGLTAGTFQHECDHLDGLPVPRSGHGHHDPHDVGAVRALPPGCLRRPDHRLRPAGRVVTVEHRRLAGLDVPVVGMGTSQTFDVPHVDEIRQRITDAALDHGATFVDSSPMYGNAERILGATLGKRRGEATVATKVWTPRDDEAERQIDASLGFFGGHVEVFQVHNLVAWPARLDQLERRRADGAIDVVARDPLERRRVRRAGGGHADRPDRRDPGAVQPARA